MSKNPSIHELKQSGRFDLIAEPEHNRVKEFVLEQIREKGKLVKIYTIYQLVMMVAGVFFLGRAITQSVKGESDNLIYASAAIIFSFTLLIIAHEALHGIALKLAGAPKVSYGGNFKKFIFYAQADRFVMNRQQFIFIALTPFVVIKLASIVGIILFFYHPGVYFFITLVCLHSLFCAGDIGLIAFFNLHKYSEIYTYDSKEEKKSYFYKMKNEEELY
ncbi:hypothetical protein MNBD_BACTEROID01-2325 [hydrothermal vent metagenome]|uniref:DUF3267 domain-containing protein n=1 Tax=hydrothermal vent metagenome TaxID=652676 RepID=A0A3B0TWI2_9ZZZZ